VQITWGPDRAFQQQPGRNSKHSSNQGLGHQSSRSLEGRQATAFNSADAVWTTSISLRCWNRRLKLNSRQVQSEDCGLA
jgi:hypothetical protein